MVHTDGMSQEANDDPYRWLEDLAGDEAAGWVRDRNAHSVGTLATGTRFTELQAQLRQVLDAEDRIPFPSWHGGHLYNFWKDGRHPRGLWRCATVEEYRRREPDWQPLLDLDALAEAEGENWVWQGATMLRPAGRRALLSLSRGGS